MSKLTKIILQWVSGFSMDVYPLEWLDVGELLVELTDSWLTIYVQNDHILTILWIYERIESTNSNNDITANVACIFLLSIKANSINTAHWIIANFS